MNKSDYFSLINYYYLFITMKKIYSLVALVAMSFGANAQSNLDYEGAVQSALPGIVEYAEGWERGLYSIGAGNNSNNAAVLKGITDAQVLALIDASEPVAGACLQEVNGAVSGIESATFSVDYNYTPVGGDSAIIIFQIYDTLATGLNDDLLLYDGTLIITTATNGWQSTGQVTLEATGATGTPNQLYFGGIAAGFATFNTASVLMLDNWEINGLTVGVKEVEMVSANVFPNPAKDVVNISMESGVFASVDVLTLDGKVVISTTDSKVDVSELTSGMYIFQIKATNGATSTQKVTVK